MGGYPHRHLCTGCIPDILLWWRGGLAGIVMPLSRVSMCVCFRNEKYSATGVRWCEKSYIRVTRF